MLEPVQAIGQHCLVQHRGPIIRKIWAACLFLAGLNHAYILFRHGLFWDYHGVGVVSATYWSSLTIINPLVAAALIWRPRLGVPLAALLIATNVAHNLVVAAHRTPDDEWLRTIMTTPQTLSQIAFLLFVIATWRIAWGDIRPPE